jgi:hypothetical protein
MPYSLDFNERFRKFIRPTFLIFIHLIQYFIPVVKHIYRQQKLTSYYKLFIVTLPVPFVDKLIAHHFIIATVFWVHKQGIDSHAINNYSTQHPPLEEVRLSFVL